MAEINTLLLIPKIQQGDARKGNKKLKYQTY